MFKAVRMALHLLDVSIMDERVNEVGTAVEKQPLQFYWKGCLFSLPHR